MLKTVTVIVRAVSVLFRVKVAWPKESGRGSPPLVVGGVVPAGGGSWSCVRWAAKSVWACACPNVTNARAATTIRLLNLLRISALLRSL